MLVEIKPAYKSIEKIKELFKEYTYMLVKEDEDFAKYLKLQDYESELENLDINMLSVIGDNDNDYQMLKSFNGGIIKKHNIMLDELNKKEFNYLKKNLHK